MCQISKGGLIELLKLDETVGALRSSTGNQIINESLGVTAAAEFVSYKSYINIIKTPLRNESKCDRVESPNKVRQQKGEN